MHIVFVTPEFPSDEKFIGGLGNYVYRVAKGLVARGLSVSVILAADKSAKEHVVEGIRVIQLQRSGRTLPVLFFNLVTLMTFRRALALHLDGRLVAQAIRKLHNTDPIDILQVPSILPLSRYQDSYLKGIPYCVRISSYRPYWHRYMKTRASLSTRSEERQESEQLRRAPFVYGPSETLRQILRTEEGLEDMRVIRPPFSLNPAPLDRSVYDERLAGKNYVLFFGKADLHKGFPVLVEAMPDFFARHPKAFLVFAGRLKPSQFSAGLPAQVKEILTRYKERIIILPTLRHPQLYPVVQGAKLVALPSLIDNLPNVCLEAMALGKPVVGTYGTSFDELLDDGKTGFLVPPGDAHALSVKLQEAWERADLAEIGKAAKAYIEKEFAPEQAIDALLAFYEKVILNWPNTQTS